MEQIPHCPPPPPGDRCAPSYSRRVRQTHGRDGPSGAPGAWGTGAPGTGAPGTGSGALGSAGRTILGHMPPTKPTPPTPTTPPGAVRMPVPMPVPILAPGRPPVRRHLPRRLARTRPLHAPLSVARTSCLTCHMYITLPIPHQPFRQPCLALPTPPEHGRPEMGMGYPLTYPAMAKTPDAITHSPQNSFPYSFPIIPAGTNAI